MTTAVGERPLGRLPAVVEDRLAHDLDLDRAVDAFDRPHEQVVRVVVGGWTGVWGDRVVPIRRSDRQRVANDHPAGRGLPRRHEDVRARFVVSGRGMVDPVRTKAEVPGLAVEQRAEDARRVEPRNAEPADAPIGCDESTRVAIGEECVFGDRRERRGRGGALRHLLLGHDSIHGSCQRL